MKNPHRENTKWMDESGIAERKELDVFSNSSYVAQYRFPRHKKKDQFLCLHGNDQ